jgi:hypothetical protein
MKTASILFGVLFSFAPQIPAQAVAQASDLKAAQVESLYFKDLGMRQSWISSTVLDHLVVVPRPPMEFRVIDTSSSKIKYQDFALPNPPPPGHDPAFAKIIKLSDKRLFMYQANNYDPTPQDLFFVDFDSQAPMSPKIHKISGGPQDYKLGPMQVLYIDSEVMFIQEHRFAEAYYLHIFHFDGDDIKTPPIRIELDKKEDQQAIENRNLLKDMAVSVKRFKDRFYVTTQRAHFFVLDKFGKRDTSFKNSWPSLRPYAMNDWQIVAAPCRFEEDQMAPCGIQTDMDSEGRVLVLSAGYFFLLDKDLSVLEVSPLGWDGALYLQGSPTTSWIAGLYTNGVSWFVPKPYGTHLKIQRDYLGLEIQPTPFGDWFLVQNGYADPDRNFFFYSPTQGRSQKFRFKTLKRQDFDGIYDFAITPQGKMVMTSYWGNLGVFDLKQQ